MTIPSDRDVTAAFHLEVGTHWLAGTDEGHNSNALVYCGFEFRLALERVALEFLIHIRRNESFTEADLKAMNKVGNIQRRIYELVGHQKRINKQVEFINIMIEVFDHPFRMSSVDLGKLARYWAECSELCHMQLSKKHTWEVKEVRRDACNTLLEIKEFLTNAISGLTWFSTYDFARDLQEKFIDGLITKEDVLNKLKETGIYATITLPDETVQILPGFEPGSHLEKDN